MNYTHTVAYWNLVNGEYEIDCFYGDYKECQKFVDRTFLNFHEYQIKDIELIDFYPQALTAEY